jgi:DUF4097 and DUF4098 domain-containing protein YvlB
MRLACCIAAALIICGQHASADDTVEKSVAADPRGDVEITNVSGDVQVSGWDRAEVAVTAELGSGVERLDVVSEPQRTIVKVVLPKGHGSGGSTDLMVRVPRDSSLTISTVSADQTIADVRGAQRLQAVSGTITTQVWGADFEAKTVSGEVTVSGHGGKGIARVSSVSGNLSLDNIGSELELGTVSGDMNVRTDQLTRARIKTTNGDLDLVSSLVRDARIEAEAINGDLRFHLRGAVNAMIDVATFNGDIDNCFGPKPRRTSEYAPGNELRFQEGDGAGLIRIKTLNGGVELCKR